MEAHISRIKRLFSDIVLTYKQVCRKSSIKFFVVIFCTYVICTVGDFKNRQYFFSTIFNDYSMAGYIKSIGILLSISFVHFFYVIDVSNSFRKMSFKESLTQSKYKLVKVFCFILIVFGVYFLSFKFLSYGNLKFSSLWLYIFLNYFKLILIYMIISVVTLALININHINQIFYQLNIIKFGVNFIKIISSILIFVLLLSPFIYSIENNLLYIDPFSSSQSLLNWNYYILECIINTLIVIFLYNFIGVLYHNKDRKYIQRTTFKKITLISLSFLYLFVWFTCGVIYQTLAKQSNGRDFIFQEDIKIKLQAKALKESTNINVDEYTICDLIKNGEFQKDNIIFKKSKDGVIFTSSDNSTSNIDIVEDFDFDENEGTLCVNQIGKHWAEFYSSDFYNKGVSYYKFEVKDSIQAPSGIGIKSEKLYPVIIYLYSSKNGSVNFNLPQSNNIRLLSPNEDINNYNLISQYTILIEDSSFIFKLKDEHKKSDDNNNPMFSNLTNMMQHSITYISYDYKMISDKYNMIETNGIRYPLIDFLYYSAVTITTTGYGDILPNSTIIRTIVMFETFFGIGIPGFFVSLLFFRVGRKENK